MNSSASQLANTIDRFGRRRRARARRATAPAPSSTRAARRIHAAVDCQASRWLPSTTSSSGRSVPRMVPTPSRSAAPCRRPSRAASPAPARPRPVCDADPPCHAAGASGPSSDFRITRASRAGERRADDLRQRRRPPRRRCACAPGTDAHPGRQRIAGHQEVVRRCRRAGCGSRCPTGHRGRPCPSEPVFCRIGVDEHGQRRRVARP